MYVVMYYTCDTFWDACVTAVDAVPISFLAEDLNSSREFRVRFFSVVGVLRLGLRLGLVGSEAMGVSDTLELLVLRKGPLRIKEVMGFGDNISAPTHTHENYYYIKGVNHTIQHRHCVVRI